MEIAVEALEAGVEIGRQGDEEELDVQRLEGEAAREAAQPDLLAGRLRGIRLGLDRRAARPRRTASASGPRSGPCPPPSRWSTWASET